MLEGRQRGLDSASESERESPESACELFDSVREVAAAGFRRAGTQRLSVLYPMVNVKPKRPACDLESAGKKGRGFWSELVFRLPGCGPRRLLTSPVRDGRRFRGCELQELRLLDHRAMDGSFTSRSDGNAHGGHWRDQRGFTSPPTYDVLLAANAIKECVLHEENLSRLGCGMRLEAAVCGETRSPSGWRLAS